MYRVLVMSLVVCAGFAGSSSAASGAEFPFTADPSGVIPAVMDPGDAVTALVLLKTANVAVTASVRHYEQQLPGQGKVASLIASTFAPAAIVRSMAPTGFPALLSAAPVLTTVAFSANSLFDYGFGRFSFAVSTAPAGILADRVKRKGPNIDAVGTLPITARFFAFGRFGLNYAETRDPFTGNGLVNMLNPNPSKRHRNFKFGVGLQYDFSESLGINAELERYRINDAVGNKGSVDLLSVSVIYRFSPP